MNSQISNRQMDRPTVLHIVTGLETGGAELMLYKLLSVWVSGQEWEYSVLSLLEPGAVAPMIRGLDIPVESVDMKPGRIGPARLIALQKHIRELKPDILQTWMYHADLLGGLAGHVAGCERIVWNVRNSNLEPAHEKQTTLWAMRACARLSSWIPDRIVTCAAEAERIHVEYGYDESKMTVIPNGFDVDRFQPDPQARREMRSELDVDLDTPLVGMVGRFHPQKDHAMFVRAADRVKRDIPRVHFVACGDDVTWENAELCRWIDERRLRRRFQLLGRRSDVERVLASLDIAVLSSSSGEAFPNVVGEAMASGVPCVVTDVGDVAKIVGDTGQVVPPEDDKAFAAACVELLELSAEERWLLGVRARERILEKFDIKKVAREYQSLYEELLR